MREGVDETLVGDMVAINRVFDTGDAVVEVEGAPGCWDGIIIAWFGER